MAKKKRWRDMTTQERSAELIRLIEERVAAGELEYEKRTVQLHVGEPDKDGRYKTIDLEVNEIDLNKRKTK